MVGDRLNTDILMGLNGQIITLMVLTGVSKKDDVEKSDIKPHFILDYFGQLFELCQ